ncbi:MAG: hypothetical protein BGO14_04770 [Chlamydiales bacterium 38-26]|nr:hypothetical protein [Chlamydiales bacterium]OJV07803.1 MAG: hypothetical protein BGO14_04770 [Chlamydiales bacterium 38-26]
MTSSTNFNVPYFRNPSPPTTEKVNKKSGIADFQYHKWLQRTTPHFQNKKISKRRILNNELKSENLLIYTSYEDQLKKNLLSPQKTVSEEITAEGIIDLKQESRIRALNLFPAETQNISFEAYQKFIYDLTQHPTVVHLKNLKVTAGTQIINAEQNLSLTTIYSLPDLVQLLVKTPHIKNLSLQGIAAKEGGELFKTISLLSDLKSLELSEVMCEDFDQLIYLKKLEKLELFKMRDCPFVSVEHLEFLKKMTSVKKIVINNRIL